MSHQEAVKTRLNGKTNLKPRDTEVVPKAKRREFSSTYKNQILAEVDGCTTAGQIGSILRREGLYSSHLTTWRRQRERGELSGSALRGRPAKSEAEQELTRLRQENEQLQQRLEQAEAILDIQKKVSQLIGLNLNGHPPDGSK
jgi:transposase-like protein